MIFTNYKRLPELAHIAPEHRRAAWINFTLSRPPADTRATSRRLGAVVIAGMLIGIVCGACFIPASPETAVFIGMILGLLLPLFGYHFIHLHSVRPALRSYLASPEFTLMPISNRAALFIHFGKPPEK